MEPALGEFESYAGQFEFAVPVMPLVCNRTGAVLSTATPSTRNTGDDMPASQCSSPRVCAPSPSWAARC